MRFNNSPISADPVRFPPGTDTVAKIVEKNRFVESELEQWRDLALSTDHDDVKA